MELSRFLYPAHFKLIMSLMKTISPNQCVNWNAFAINNLFQYWRYVASFHLVAGLIAYQLYLTNVVILTMPVLYFMPKHSPPPPLTHHKLLSSSPIWLRFSVKSQSRTPFSRLFDRYCCVNKQIRSVSDKLCRGQAFCLIHTKFWTVKL